MESNGDEWSTVERITEVKQFRGFFGNFQHSLDDKGRVFIPAKFKPGVTSGFMLTKWLDRCLAAYPMEEWDKMMDMLEYIPFTDRDGREFTRLFSSSAIDCDMDKQGRIIIPHPILMLPAIPSTTLITKNRIRKRQKPMGISCRNKKHVMILTSENRRNMLPERR